MRRNSMGTSLKPAPGISGALQELCQDPSKDLGNNRGWRQLSCQRERLTSLAFLLLAVAALLLPLDVAARRLVISRGDRRAWSEALQRPESRVPAAVEPTLERLKERLEKGR